MLKEGEVLEGAMHSPKWADSRKKPKGPLCFVRQEAGLKSTQGEKLWIFSRQKTFLETFLYDLLPILSDFLHKK